MLAEHHLQVLKMLDYQATSSPSTFLQDVQDVSLVIAEYLKLKDNISYLIIEIDVL